MIWLRWIDDRYIPKVQHAFSPDCTEAIKAKRDAALKALEDQGPHTQQGAA